MFQTKSVFYQSDDEILYPVLHLVLHAHRERERDEPDTAAAHISEQDNELFSRQQHNHQQARLD